MDLWGWGVVQEVEGGGGRAGAVVVGVAALHLVSIDTIGAWGKSVPQRGLLSAAQASGMGWGTRLHADLDIDKRPLEYPYGPYSKPVRIVAEVGGRKIEFQQAGGPEAHEHTFDGFDAGEHLIRLQITDGQSPITQHELVMVQVE